MPPQLREIGCHVQNHATQWHGFQHEIQFQEVVVAWIQLTLKTLQSSTMNLSLSDDNIAANVSSNFFKLDFMLKSMPLSGMIFNVKPNFTELWWHESNFP